MLIWEHSYEIVLRLQETYPDVDIDAVGLQQLFEWVTALPDFGDDPNLVTDDILNDILREWYEEINAL